MTLRLTIISANKQSLGEHSSMEFGENGGTIGRSLEADWVLPDGKRFLSSRHAAIDFRSGSYYIVDMSKNGVFVNGDEQPVGRGKPQRLFSGDRVRLGEYDILVEIDELEGTRDQMADIPHVDPVDRAQRVTAPEPPGKDLVDAFEVTGVGIEHLLDSRASDTVTPADFLIGAGDLELVDDEPAPPAPVKPPSAKPATEAVRPKAAREAPPAKPQARPRSVPPSQPVARPDAPNAAVSPVASATARAKAQQSQDSRVREEAARPAAKSLAQARAAKSSSGSSADVLDAFFRGAGLQAPALEAEEVEQLMLRLGQITRETVVGLSAILQVRASQKTVLRQSHTMIQPIDNNALKFSADVEEAFQVLLFKESAEYLGSVDAVRAAFSDIREHQLVLMKSLLIAVAEYLAELDPERLESKFAGQRSGVLGAATVKFKYWDLYKEFYEVVARQNRGELPDVFREKFARAYEAELMRVRKPSQGQPGSAGQNGESTEESASAGATA